MKYLVAATQKYADRECWTITFEAAGDRAAKEKFKADYIDDESDYYDVRLYRVDGGKRILLMNLGEFQSEIKTKVEAIVSQIAWEEAAKIVGWPSAHDIEGWERWNEVYRETYDDRYPGILHSVKEFALAAA